MWSRVWLCGGRLLLGSVFLALVCVGEKWWLNMRVGFEKLGLYTSITMPVLFFLASALSM